MTTIRPPRTSEQIARNGPNGKPFTVAEQLRFLKKTSKVKTGRKLADPTFLIHSALPIDLSIQRGQYFAANELAREVHI